jgi:hypothetical protein
MNQDCEVAECDRAAITDVTTTNRDGSTGELMVCQPCFHAWQIGRNDPNA